MNSMLHLIFLPFIALFSHGLHSDESSLLKNYGSIEGMYEGYRSQFYGKETASDSTKIKLKVTRLSTGKLEILQIIPNKFKYLVIFKKDRFTYDLGLGEAACGVTHISGVGYIRENRLYLREKSECKNTKATEAHFIELRAQKL